jgi:hypothetical protein
MHHTGKQPKYGIPVRVVLTNGEALMGLVYVQWGQRVRDALNEREPFLAIKTVEQLRLVNKTAIVHVDLLTMDEISRQQGLFPEIDFEYLSLNPC